jgi:acetyl esterase/lipase
MRFLSVTSAGLLALLAFEGCATRAWFRPSALPEGGREVRDVAYWQGDDFDDKKHRLDIYTPPGPGPFPVVVFVHGGGWLFGDRQQLGGNYEILGRRFARQGVMAVVTSYRLAPFSHHPDQIHDVARALRWTFDHAPEYGGDPTAIFAMGHSAGAQLVALAATDPRWLHEVGLAPRQLAGVIAISGPYDVAHLGSSLFIGGPMVIPAFGSDRAVWRDVMPANHLRDGPPPPFFVAWADGDFEVLRRDAHLFVSQLEEAHVPVETFESPYDDHLSVITEFADVGNALGEHTLTFIQRHMLEIRKMAQSLHR